MSAIAENEDKGIDVFKLEMNFDMVREKLEKIYAISSTLRNAEESLDDNDKDYNLIALMKVVEDISSDFKPVYEIERVIKSIK